MNDSAGIQIVPLDSRLRGNDGARKSSVARAQFHNLQQLSFWSRSDIAVAGSFAVVCSHTLPCFAGQTMQFFG
jgi:hypothetical protein